MAVHLIGGGRDEAALAELYGPFLTEAGPDPVVACILIDEGDGAESFAWWESALRKVAPCRPEAVLVPIGGTLDPAALGTADAVFVGGGLTPAYQAALSTPLAGYMAGRRLPYAGFSAGAAIAAQRTLVGGWMAAGVPVCPDETAEDLDEIEVREGLGLVDFVVDVHAAQWGTLPRLIEAVTQGNAEYGLAIDENTAVATAGVYADVRGLGRVHLVQATAGGVTVRAYRAGERIKLNAVAF